MKKIKIALISLLALVGVMTTAPMYAYASPATQIQNGVNSVSDGSKTDIGTSFKTIVNVILFILGAISVIMIVIGGVRYTLSGGDSGSTKGAKDTILYAVVGLVVAMLAYAIVNFVITSFK